MSDMLISAIVFLDMALDPWRHFPGLQNISNCHRELTSLSVSRPWLDMFSRSLLLTLPNRLLVG